MWGETVLAKLLERFPESSDQELAERLRGIGRRIARVSDRPNHLYRFLVVESETPQAFSTPCGFVCVTDSLLRVASDDEIAFSVGHEIAHTTLRHQINQLRVEEIIKAGRSVDEELLTLVLSNLQLESEMEADRYGVLYGVRAGYRYSASTDILRKLQRFIGSASPETARAESEARIDALRGFQDELELTLEKFRTGTQAINNGDVEEAIANLRLFVVQFPDSISGRVNLGSAFLAKVREEAGTPQGLSEVLPTLPDPGISVRGIINRMDLDHARENFLRALQIQDDAMAQAGLGLVYARLNDYVRARTYLDRAQAGAPGLADLALCQGNVEFLDTQYEDATFYYREALRLKPSWGAATRNLAMTYEKLEDFDQAHNLWNSLREDARLQEEAVRHLRYVAAQLDQAPSSR